MESQWRLHWFLCLIQPIKHHNPIRAVPKEVHSVHYVRSFELVKVKLKVKFMTDRCLNVLLFATSVLERARGRWGKKRGGANQNS